MPKGKRDKGKDKTGSKNDDVSKNDPGNEITVTGKPTQGPKTEADFLAFGCTPEIAKILANALQQKAPITTLNLSYKHIDAEGAKALAEALQHNRSITTLDLSYNRIGDDGAKAVAEALQHNTTITTLDLSCNDIGDDGAKALAEALKHNRSITTLDLSYNSIGADVQKVINLLLERNLHKTMQDAQKMLLPDITVHHELLKALPTTLQHTALPENTASEEGPSSAPTCESQQIDANSLQQTIVKLESIKQKFLAACSDPKKITLLPRKYFLLLGLAYAVAYRHNYKNPEFSDTLPKLQELFDHGNIPLTSFDKACLLQQIGDYQNAFRLLVSHDEPTDRLRMLAMMSVWYPHLYDINTGERKDNTSQFFKTFFTIVYQQLTDSISTQQTQDHGKDKGKEKVADEVAGKAKHDKGDDLPKRLNHAAQFFKTFFTNVYQQLTKSISTQQTQDRGKDKGKEKVADEGAGKDKHDKGDDLPKRLNYATLQEMIISKPLNKTDLPALNDDHQKNQYHDLTLIQILMAQIEEDECADHACAQVVVSLLYPYLYDVNTPNQCRRR